MGYYQSHPYRRTKVVLFNLSLEGGDHTFSKGISSKVDVTARLEFELAYYDVTV